LIDLKLREYLFKTISKSSTFGVSDLNVSELLELLDGVCKMHDVLASFKEAIESNEQSIGCDFPLVFGLGLIVKVSIFEFIANINDKGEFLVGFFDVTGIN